MYKENRFYKGRYLIALYNENDEWFGSYNNLSEMQNDFHMHTLEQLQSHIGHIFADRKRLFHGLSVHFIDVYEKHDDIFAEEDAEYLRVFKYKQTNRQKCIEWKIPERTYYRYKELYNVRIDKELAH